MKKTLFIVAVTAMVLAGCATKAPTPTPSYSKNINVTKPVLGQEMQSPFTVEGKVIGTWFFEASFPIKLVDERGKVLATTIAQAQGDWMTTDWVPFQANLQFNVTEKTPAILVLEKDNPSGLVENNEAMSIPVILAPTK